MRPNWGLLIIGLLIVVMAAYAAWDQLQQPPELIVEWVTESQVNTAGFFVYRAEAPDGPWTQANAEMVPATDDILTGAHYVYTDTGVLVGHTYYYELEDVDFDGARRRTAIGSGVPPGPSVWVLALSGVGALVGLYLLAGGLGVGQPARRPG
jgi:hypothetical protein